MKNIIILGLVATLLFGVSAGLSMYLKNPAFFTGETEHAKAEKKAAAKTKAKTEEHEEQRPAIRPQPLPGSEEMAKVSNQYAEQMAALREREARLDRRQSQIDVVMQDVRAERQTLDGIRTQVGNELKLLAQKVTELEQLRQTGAKTVADAKAKVAEVEDGERKNMDRMASMYDSMPAENAAKIIQQMADMGKMDTAVRLLSQMKERQAAKVLAEISDPTLAAQLLDKMRTLRRSNTTSTTTAAAQ